MKRTVVFEISQLAKWPGMATGIPRTMEELAVRFSADDALFVDWNPVAKHFYLTTYDEATLKRNMINNVMHVKHRSTIKKAVGYLTDRSRVAEKSVLGAKRLLRILRPEKGALTQPYEFSENDIFFICWGEAVDSIYTDAVVDAHNKGAAIAQFAHDMIPTVVPQFAGHTTEGLKRYASKVFPISSVIIANSINTKKDVETWLKDSKFPLVPVKVMRLGDNFSHAEAKPVSDEKFNASGLKGGDYIITVGTIEARKNHTLYYYVYKLAYQRGITLPKLVIVGRQGWMTSELLNFIANDPEVNTSIVVLNNVSDEELSWLYENCLFSVYASFYEGWGLPIAESISRGVPCISSNTSSMPEVAGDLVFRYISPASTDECLSAIEDLNNTKRLATERKRIQAFKTFSWDASYAQIKEIIKDI